MPFFNMRKRRILVSNANVVYSESGVLPNSFGKPCLLVRYVRTYEHVHAQECITTVFCLGEEQD